MITTHGTKIMLNGGRVGPKVTGSININRQGFHRSLTSRGSE